MRWWAVIFVWLAVVVGGGSAAGIWWWKENRMQLFCLTDGLWSEAAPGFRNAVKIANQPGEAGEDYRIWLLLRHDGQGVCAPEDERKFWDFVEKASVETDWREAHSLLAFRYGYGIQNSEQAEKLADVVPLQKNGAITGLHIGEAGSGEGKLKLEESFDLIKRAAEQGQFWAMLAVSDAYLLGKWGKNGAMDIGKAPDKSLYFLEEVAKEGHVAAMYHAGHRLLYGVGVNANFHKARDYLLGAAMRMDENIRMNPETAIYTAAAMSELAFMHAEGKAFPRDFDKANEWMEKAEKVIAISDNTAHQEYIERQRLRFGKHRYSDRAGK